MYRSVVLFNKTPIYSYRNEEWQMSSTDQLMTELFALALYQNFTPQERCAMLKLHFPELTFPFLEGTDHMRVSSQKKQAFTSFKSSCNVLDKIRETEEAGVDWVTIFDPGYPEALRHIYAPPLVLFFKGRISLLHFPSIGVVGSRACTSYGKQAIRKLLPPLIEADYPIVSGLAKGLDTEAHQTAIDHEGQTIAVIGTGLDRFYPAQNRDLQQIIAQQQLIVSEYPIKVGPKKHHFPFRNRIIAGLSRGVLVIEARERSGSLITARQALDNGKDVFAVPGSIFAPQSVGCNHLIQAGAKAVLKAEDILEEFVY